MFDLSNFDNLLSTWTWLPYTNLVTLGFIIFFIGLYGIVFNFKNFLITMLCIELTYLGASLIFIINSVYFLEATGMLYALTLTLLAAAEAAVGLGLLIVIYRYEKKIDFANFTSLA